MKAEEKMKSMKTRLNILWNRLETPDQTREEFLADKVSLSQDTFTAVSNVSFFKKSYFILLIISFIISDMLFLQRAKFSYSSFHLM